MEWMKRMWGKAEDIPWIECHQRHLDGWLEDRHREVRTMTDGIVTFWDGSQLKFVFADAGYWGTGTPIPCEMTIYVREKTVKETVEQEEIWKDWISREVTCPTCHSRASYLYGEFANTDGGG